MRTQLEHERKFLVRNDDWKSDVQASVAISQLYLPSVNGAERRIRLEHQKNQASVAFLVTKNYQSDGVAHTQLEPIPIEEARKLFSEYGQSGKEMALIEKTRHFLGAAWKDGWCVDVFHGPLHGLTVAEYEVKDASLPERLHKPAWVGREVTQLKSYRNESLSRNGMPKNQREV